METFFSKSILVVVLQSIFGGFLTSCAIAHHICFCKSVHKIPYSVHSLAQNGFCFLYSTPLNHSGLCCLQNKTPFCVVFCAGCGRRGSHCRTSHGAFPFILIFVNLTQIRLMEIYFHPSCVRGKNT